MRKPKDGGPAFPFDEIDPNEGHYDGRYEVKRQHDGMSLRAWLAGQAISGMTDGVLGMIGNEPSAHAHGACNSVIAERAIALADEIIRRLEADDVL